ncbi:MAG: hypothetical protein QOE17_1307, partial [Gaiellales bacterium]|nr:hypothetical protein [Gaiellales bacterium]
MVDREHLASVLGEFARTLLTDFPIQGILDHLVGRVVDVLPVTGAGVTLISTGLAPQYVAASDDRALRYEKLQSDLSEGPCILAFTSGEPVHVPDLAADDRFPEFGPAALAADLRSVSTFPLGDRGARLGSMDLYSSRLGRLGTQDLVAAQTLADVAGAYLLNAQARQRLVEDSERFRQSALHDALTGLPNRTLLQQRLEHAAQRAKRSHSTAALLFADLDKFKRINDSYGHGVGDELLVAVGRRLSALLRPGDTLARISGDEFVILCEELTQPADI